MINSDSKNITLSTASNPTLVLQVYLLIKVYI